MQYDSYRQRVKRVAGILGRVYAHRLIIGIALGVVALVITALVMTKGLLVAESDCPSEITYGEKLGYRVSFMTSITVYEYREQGSTVWTEEKPEFPGNYQVRASGRKASGERVYTEIRDFTILPREISLTLKDTTFEYGGSPTVVADLAKGDILTCSVSYNGWGTSSTTARPDVSTLSITNKKGEDRLAGYRILPVSSTDVTIKPRSIKITVRDATKVYDDTALSFDGYEVSGGSLVEGDELVAIFRDTLVDAGSKSNTPELRVYDRNGYDVTLYYSFSVKSGQLTVEKRPLIVQAADSTFVYSGVPMDHRNYFVDSSTSLVSGHRLEVKTASTILDVGTAPNVLTFTIRNRSGGDESRNYSVFIKEGTLTVTPRAVSVQTESNSLVYDGTDQSHPYVTVKNGVGDEYRVEGATTLRDVGRVENRMTVKFYRDGKDITSNYIINGYTYGTLEITPRPLSVQLNHSEKIYDGTPLKAGEFMINENRYPLPKGHTLTLKAEGEVLFGTVPQTYVEGSARVTDADGRDVTKNFSITVTDGTLTVNPRPVTITTNSASKVYDGEPLYSPDWMYPGSALLEGHELSVTVTGVSIVDVGSATNTVERHLTRIFDTRTDEDVSMYYDVTYSEGVLSISPRPITVATLGGEWMYDGRPHEGDIRLILEEGTLVSGHHLVHASLQPVTVTNAGTVSNAVEARVMADSGEDLTHNYKITHRYGTLTVTKRPITVVLESAELTYDGQPHAFKEVRLHASSPYGLVLDHTLMIQNRDLLYFTDAGTYENDMAVTVYSDSEVGFVTANYDITRMSGTVDVRPRSISIRMDGEKIYDGEAMDREDLSITVRSGTLVDGHILTAEPESVSYPVNAGSKTVSMDPNTVQIRDGSGIDRTRNYQIRCLNGTLTVSRRPISVETATAEKLYDGLPLTAYGVTVTKDSMPLVEGHSVSMVVTGKGTQVGTYPNTAVSTTFGVSMGGKDVTANYELISVTEGVLTVKYPTILSVSTGSAEKLYDGIPLTCPDYELEVGGDPLPAGYRVSVTVTGSLRGVGKTANTAEVTVYDRQNRDVTALFTVQLHPGILTVLEDKNTVFGRVFAQTSGLIYLRQASFGSYTGQGWNAATPYSGTLTGGYSLNLLPAAALDYLKIVNTSTLTFSDMALFLLPYYAQIGGGNPVVGSDTDYGGMDLTDYTVSYYAVENSLTLLSGYSQVPAALRPYLLGSYASAEKAYRSFVYGQYLAIDGETDAFMQTIIEAEGFDPSDANVIQAVASYIQNAAVYSLNYDPALDTCENQAIAFLRDYKKGVCVHYATAATLLYRALGIPARYVTGFALDVTAGQWTEIRNPGHAWVEVYVDGLGWVAVEVTGSADTPVDPEPTLDTLELEPVFQTKVYDGSYLYPIDQLEMTPSLRKYLSMGYTYEVEILGSRREVGDGESYIHSFTLYDPLGNDVTDRFTLVKKNGLLRVTGIPIEVFLFAVEKTYDGTYTLWEEGDYMIYSIPDGCSLELKVLLYDDDFPNGITLSGLNAHRDSIATYRVLQNGEDVTANYDLIFINNGDPPLSILPRALELTAASETRVEDGTPLENGTVYVTKGSLVKGHTLSVTVSGRLETAGETDNVITDVRITDAEGRDVTDLYRVTTVNGRLVLVDDTSARM